MKVMTGGREQIFFGFSFLFLLVVVLFVYLLSLLLLWLLLFCFVLFCFVCLFFCLTLYIFLLVFWPGLVVLANFWVEPEWTSCGPWENVVRPTVYFPVHTKNVVQPTVSIPVTCSLLFCFNVLLWTQTKDRRVSHHIWCSRLLHILT